MALGKLADAGEQLAQELLDLLGMAVELAPGDAQRLVAREAQQLVAPAVTLEGVTGPVELIAVSLQSNTSDGPEEVDAYGLAAKYQRRLANWVPQARRSHQGDERYETATTPW
jgi:hypothetical protein